MVVKLKSPTIHAIRIVKYIATHQEESMIASEISKQVDLTSSYFMRLVKDLRKAGILESIQGRYGGFSLSRPLEEITLYEVVEAMQGEEPASDLSDMANLDHLLQEVNNYVSEIMLKTSLAKL